jgi:hypothetical protein
LFNRKPLLIDKNNITLIAEPYKNSIIYYCGFDNIKGGSFFSSGKNIHDNSIIILNMQGITVLSVDGEKVEFGYGGFSVYYKSQQIVFANKEDAIVCWSFLKLDQLNQISDPNSKNITDFNDQIQKNIREIENYLIQNGAEKAEVSE